MKHRQTLMGTAQVLVMSTQHLCLLYRAAAAGMLAVGSKVALMLKAGGVSGLAKGVGAVAAAGQKLFLPQCS